MLQAVPASERIHDTVLAGALGVREIGRALEAKLGGVRTLCLGIAAIYALLLLWTCHATNRPVDGSLLEIIWAFGALPAAVVAYLNTTVSHRLVEASTTRRRFEREFMEGTLQ